MWKKQKKNKREERSKYYLNAEKLIEAKSNPAKTFRLGDVKKC